MWASPPTIRAFAFIEVNATNIGLPEPAAVLEQERMRGELDVAERCAASEAQEEGMLGQEAAAAGPSSGEEDPLAKIQRLYGMELLTADSWLHSRTPADPRQRVFVGTSRNS